MKCNPMRCRQILLERNHASCNFYRTGIIEHICQVLGQQLVPRVSAHLQEDSRNAAPSHHLSVQMEDIQGDAIENRVRPCVGRDLSAHLAAAELAVVLHELLLRALHDRWPVARVGNVALPSLRCSGFAV